MNSTKICSKCGILKPLDEFYKSKDGKDGTIAYCIKCSNKESRKYKHEHKKEMAEYKKKYNQEHKKEIAERRRQIAGQISMYENKSCSSYLGVVIGERLCRHLFKDVEVMHYHNPGFDIICNKGKKIDVKTSCITLNRNKYPLWKFKINKNKVPDFFILVAFDNRADLNPLHIWMIPGHEINHLTGVSIRPTTIRKWDKWKRNIEDVQLCCNQMKDN